MKEQIKLLLTYNQSENKEVIRILEGLSADERLLDRKSYYKSLHGIADHIALVEVFYEKAILANFTKLNNIKPTELSEKIDFNAISFENFPTLKTVLEKADDEYMEIFNNLSEEELNTIITRNSPRGVVTSPAWVIILQQINHGIHHRGQIMQILEEMNIDANFGMLKYQ